MLPEMAMSSFLTALATATGATMAWWRAGSEDEDAMIANAADVVLDALADADATRMVDCRTGHNWRDQLTVEQAMELERERTLRRMKNRN